MKNTVRVLLLLLATSALGSCAAAPQHTANASVWRFLANGYDRDLRDPRISVDYERGALHIEQQSLREHDLMHTDSAHSASYWTDQVCATDRMWQCMRWTTPSLMPIPSSARVIACACCGLAGDQRSPRSGTASPQSQTVPFGFR